MAKADPAAFGRLCVETAPFRTHVASVQIQPPSGGCVLKQDATLYYLRRAEPAAFGRLCVETASADYQWYRCRPAAFGRLCVETRITRYLPVSLLPAAFGRLCVETSYILTFRLPGRVQPPSGGCVLKPRKSLSKSLGKSPAAFGRLCVETYHVKQYPNQ